MSELREAMRTAVALDEVSTDVATFAQTHGAAVARRVRMRRTVRAAGYGAVATASAGALAFGALEWARTPEPASPEPAQCLPSQEAWDQPFMNEDDVLMSSAGALGVAGGDDSDGSFHYEVAEKRLTVGLRPPEEELVLEIVDRQVVGPNGPTEEPFAITFPSGRTATLQLVWTDQRLEVGFGLGDRLVTGSAIEFTEAGPADVPGTWVPELLMFSGPVPETNERIVVLMDRGQPQVQFTIDDADGVTAKFGDGTSARFDLGDDGLITVDWVGYTTISLDPDGGFTDVAWGPTVTAPVDATISAPLACGEIRLAGPPDGEMEYIELYTPPASES